MPFHTNPDSRLTPMKGYFITGTDTDVGKTYVTAALLRAFLDEGHSALAIKPIQSGCSKGTDGLLAGDVETYARFARPYFSDGYPDACCKKFHPACSPHLAAQLAGTPLEPDELVRDIQRLAADRKLILVEGAGGAAVPLGNGQTMLDLMQRLALPVIIVADNKLGVINHALMTINAVRDRGLTVAGVVMMNTTAPNNDDTALRQDNVDTITEWGGVPLLADIPYIPGPESDPIFVHHMAAALDALPPFSTTNTENADFDRDHIWHPYTSAVKPASHCQGPEHTWYENHPGRRYRTDRRHGFLVVRHPRLCPIRPSTGRPGNSSDACPMSCSAV